MIAATEHLLLVLIGILFGFAGYRILPLFLTVCGAVFGGVMTVLYVQQQDISMVVGFAAVVIAVVVGALAFYLSFYLAVVVLSAVAFWLLCIPVWGIIGYQPNEPTILAVLILGGIIGFVAHKMIMIALTSLYGATLIVAGFSYFIIGLSALRFVELYGRPTSPFLRQPEQIATILVWLFLWFLGAFVQARRYRRKS